MSCYHLMAVLINHRVENAVQVQQALTKHGCIIKVRLGLHETDNVCADDGLVLLQLGGSEEERKALENELNAIPGVKAKSLDICSD